MRYPSVGVALINGLSYLFCLGFFHSCQLVYLALASAEAGSRAISARRTLRNEEVLWEACCGLYLRPDECCVKIRELFCSGREEIVIDFHSTHQPQLCGDFFTDAKLKQSCEVSPEHTHPFSGLCNPKSHCTKPGAWHTAGWQGCLCSRRAPVGHLQAWVTDSRGAQVILAVDQHWVSQEQSHKGSSFLQPCPVTNAWFRWGYLKHSWVPLVLGLVGFSGCTEHFQCFFMTCRLANSNPSSPVTLCIEMISQWGFLSFKLNTIF